MKRTIAIDLPVLLQGNIHHVDVPLLYDVLGKIKGLKNVEVLFENRSIPVQDGVFEDPFESWQPHVYRIVLEPNSI